MKNMDFGVNHEESTSCEYCVRGSVSGVGVGVGVGGGGGGKKSGVGNA